MRVRPLFHTYSPTKTHISSCGILLKRAQPVISCNSLLVPMRDFCNRTSPYTGYCWLCVVLTFTLFIWVTIFSFQRWEKVSITQPIADANSVRVESSKSHRSAAVAQQKLCEQFQASMLSLKESGIEASTHPLIVMTGQGTTATGSVTEALAKMGLQIGHFHRCHGCTQWNRVKWKRIHKHLMHATINTVSHKVIRELESLDGVGDQPINTLLPEILRVFPHSRVLLTTRNPTKWVESRVRNHGEDAVPLVPAAIPHQQIRSEGPERLRNRGLSRRELIYMFGVQNIVSACLGVTNQFLHMDVFSYNCDSKRLWKHLAEFVNVSRVPVIAFPGCKSRLAG